MAQEASHLLMASGPLLNDSSIIKNLSLLKLSDSVAKTKPLWSQSLPSKADLNMSYIIAMLGYLMTDVD